MLTSPPEIFAKADELKRDDQEFILASVVAIRGAASAKTGAKAIFNRFGDNILGWVGGGCAESFLARQALEALKEKAPRIVTVDLDDEVFGLMPCGGVMDVYLEPHFPAPKLEMPDMGEWQEATARFVHQLGYGVQTRANGKTKAESWRDIFEETAKALARTYDKALVPWRNLKGQGEAQLHGLSRNSTPLIVLGQTRITEELCRLAKLLQFPVRVLVQNPNVEKFPSGTDVCQLPVDVSTLDFPANSWAVVASHHQLDHRFIAHALKAPCDYIALVASEKRSGLIHQDLKNSGFTQSELARLFAPAGLVMPAETPRQIAFSILCEILFLQDGGAPWI